MPLGALNLCPATVSRSTPSASTFIGCLPTDCAASVCSRMPRVRVIAAISAIGCKLPASLLACITDTSAVSGRNARSTAASETQPVSSTGTTLSSQPWSRSAAAGAATAGCSILLITRCRLYCQSF